jgi:hypothetical protein
MQISQRLQPEWFDIDDAGFLCAPMTAAQKITVARHVERDEFGHALFAAARYAVTDWRGITQGGRPVPYTAAAFDDLFANESAAQTLVALGTFVINRARLSEDDEKK